MNDLNSLILEGEFTEIKDDMAIMKTKRNIYEDHKLKETKEFTFTVVNSCGENWELVYDYAIPVSVRVVGRIESDKSSRAYIVVEHLQISMKSKFIGKGKGKEVKDDSTEPVGEESNIIPF